MKTETQVIAFIFASILFMAVVKITNVNNVVYDAWKPDKFGTYCSVEDAPDSTLQKWKTVEKLQQKDGTLSSNDEAAFRYIQRFKHVAKQEEAKYGIPWQITIAQGLLESDKGRSRLCVEGNAHFGVKCFSETCQKGHCMNASDDSHKDFFRIFPSAWHSFRHHSETLEAERYKPCHACGDNVKCWAKQLQKCGYATSKKYEVKLLNIIKRYGI
jgi:flagellum-specific peptidoglycan hydrolase FlgJ